jgi:hypothetical protein
MDAHACAAFGLISAPQEGRADGGDMGDVAGTGEGPRDDALEDEPLASDALPAKEIDPEKRSIRGRKTPLLCM